MKREALIAFFMVLVLAGLLPPVVRGADSNRFRFLSGIATGDSVTDLVVTPDDRYVLAVSKASQSLRIVDTWDFTLVEGATVAIGEDGAKPLCITVSPYGGHAYAGLDSGEIAVIDLGPLEGLLPYEDMEGPLEVTYKTIVSGKPINRITALPDVNYANNDVYLLMGTESTLHWLALTDGVEQGNKGSYSTSQVIALNPASTRGFALFNDNTLDIITCSNSRCDPQGEIMIGGSNDIAVGIAADPANGYFAVTANLTKKELVLLDTENWGSITYGGTLQDTSFSSVSDLELLGGTTTRRAQAMTADGSIVVMVSEVSGSTMEFSGDTLGATLGGSTEVSLSSLAASSPSDGYVYAGSTAGHIYPVTGNPEVEITALNGLTVTDSEGTTIDFKVDGEEKTFDYNAYITHEFGNWEGTTAFDSGTYVAPRQSKFYVSSKDLDEECGNVITIIAQKEGYKGRNAITVYRDTKPPKPGFSLGFGYEKIIVDFTASFLCDLDHYEIFYGSSLGSTVLDSYTALEDSYNKRTISNFSAGEDIEVVIKSLQNEVKYYVYLLTFDKSGNYAISNRKSATPEEVITFTDQAGEDGGVNCLGSVSSAPAGGPVKLFGLLCPLLVAGSLLVLLRRRS